MVLRSFWRQNQLHSTHNFQENTILVKKFGWYKIIMANFQCVLSHYCTSFHETIYKGTNTCGKWLTAFPNLLNPLNRFGIFAFWKKVNFSVESCIWKFVILKGASFCASTFNSMKENIRRAGMNSKKTVVISIQKYNSTSLKMFSHHFLKWLSVLKSKENKLLNLKLKSSYIRFLIF